MSICSRLVHHLLPPPLKMTKPCWTLVDTIGAEGKRERRGSSALRAPILLDAKNLQGWQLSPKQKTLNLLKYTQMIERK